jgi:hypothetical protein
MREPAKTCNSRVNTRTRESGKPATHCKGAGFPRGGCGFRFLTYGLPVKNPTRNQPFPHKRGAQTRGRTISLPLIAPCLTPQSIPRTNRHVSCHPLTSRPHRPLEARPLCRSPSLTPKSPSKWTLTRSTRQPLPTEGLPLPTRFTPPSCRAQPSPSSKCLELEGTPKTFTEWLRSPPGHSLLAPRHTRPTSQLCRPKMTGSAPAPSPPPSDTAPVSAHRASSPTAGDSRISMSPTTDIEPRPNTSGHPQGTPRLQRVLWGNPEARSTPSNCMPQSIPLRARRMSALPPSHYQSGSEIYATPPSPTTAPSSTEAEASKTGGSPPTSPATAPPRNVSETCTPPRRGSSPALPDSGRAWTSSHSAWGLPERGSASGAITTSSMSSPQPSITTPADEDASSIRAVGGLRTKGRVMSSVASIPRHSYVFC